MKQAYLLITIVCCISGVQAQDFNLGSNLSLYLGKKSPTGISPDYANFNFQGAIGLLDINEIALYDTIVAGVLDDLSHANFTIGGNLTPDKIDFGAVAKISYNLDIQTNEGVVHVEDKIPVSSVMRANYTYVAQNARALNGNQFDSAAVLFNQAFPPPPNIQNNFLINSVNSFDSTSIFQPINTSSIYYSDTGYLAVSGANTPVGVLGSGTAIPIVFGNSTPAQIEHFYTICIPSLGSFFNGLGVEIKEGHSPVDHATAAIYAANLFSPQGVGLFANGAARGIYSQGQTGVIGISTGTGNGASIWGFAGSAPAAGGYKYAVYGDSQGFNGAWSAAFFGNGFYTGTWSMASDMRLKTKVRAQTDALHAIMQLQPSQYEYLQDTPYSLPQGLHHGFIAQELESVLPELVSDITMPRSLDPNSQDGETDVYKAINYTELIAVLTSAFQELNAKVDAQAAVIAELQAALSMANDRK